MKQILKTGNEINQCTINMPAATFCETGINNYTNEYTNRYLIIALVSTNIEFEGAAINVYTSGSKNNTMANENDNAANTNNSSAIANDQSANTNYKTALRFSPSACSNCDFAIANYHIVIGNDDPAYTNDNTACANCVSAYQIRTSAKFCAGNLIYPLQNG